MSKYFPFVFLIFSFNAYAQQALLGVYCMEETQGAKVFINNEYRFDCQDFERQAISLAPGEYKIKSILEIDDKSQKTFEQTILLNTEIPSRIKIRFDKITLTEYGKQVQEQQQKEAALQKKAKLKQQAIASLQSDIKNAEAGDLQSIENVIERYKTGNGVEVSEERVLYWSEKLKQQSAVKAKQDKIKQLESKLANNPQFYWTKLSGIVLKKGAPFEKSTATTGIPLFVVTDILTAPSVYFKRKKIREELNQIETQAIRWANPDAMVAKTSFEK